MSDSQARIHAIYRYPVKGLSPESLTQTPLRTGETVPADRLYAIENGPSGFDAARPSYLPKTCFLMLMRNERLARLDTRLDVSTHVLTIATDGRTQVSGDLRTDAGRRAVESFFATYCADELNGAPQVLAADGHSFSDIARKVLSLINLASVGAIENLVGAPVDPLRFRANVYVAGWPAWHEFNLLNRTISIGPHARLKVVKRIVRCAATNVDPQTGIRDLSIPNALLRRFDHADCGIYAQVVTGGDIAVGDQLTEIE